MPTLDEIFKVRDDEGHEHGSDGRFVSSGGSSGSSEEDEAQAKVDAYLKKLKAAMEERLNPKPVPEPWREDAYAKAGKVDLLPTSYLMRFRGNELRRNDDEMQEMADDIKANGMREPVVMQFGKNDHKLMLGEGNHRLAAARRAGITHIPVRMLRSTNLDEDRAVADHGDSMSRVKPGEYFPGDAAPSDVLDDFEAIGGISGKEPPKQKHRYGKPGQPTVSVDVSKVTKTSFTGNLWHTTSKDSANKIVESGFNSPGKNGGKYFGPGTYFYRDSASPATAYGDTVVEADYSNTPLADLESRELQNLHYEAFDAIKAQHPDMPVDEIKDAAKDSVANSLIDAGFDGIQLGAETIIFDGSKKPKSTKIVSEHDVEKAVTIADIFKVKDAGDEVKKMFTLQDVMRDALAKSKDSEGHDHGKDGRFVGQDGGGYKHGEATNFPYFRNTKSAPKTGGYGQDIEPHGRYMSERSQSPEDFDKWAADHTDARTKYEQGTAQFKSPIVMPFGGQYGDESNWKNVLAAHYGKTGKDLSHAIAADGYDGIITHDKYGTSEVVDLSPFAQAQAKAEKIDKNPKVAALRAAGRIKNGDGSKPCAECASYPEVLDGFRKAAPGKYELDGKANYCGQHVVRMAEGRDTTFNHNTGKYQAASPKTTQKPAVKNPDHIRVPKPPEPCGGGIYAKNLCSTHAGRVGADFKTHGCSTFQRKTKERNEALAAREAAQNNSLTKSFGAFASMLKSDDGPEDEYKRWTRGFVTGAFSPYTDAVKNEPDEDAIPPDLGAAKHALRGWQTQPAWKGAQVGTNAHYAAALAAYATQMGAGSNPHQIVDQAAQGAENVAQANGTPNAAQQPQQTPEEPVEEEEFDPNAPSVENPPDWLGDYPEPMQGEPIIPPPGEPMPHVLQATREATASAEKLANDTVWPEVAAKPIAGATGRSNQGGIYEVGGVQGYAKFYADPEQAQSEKLANDLYRAVGINAPKSRLVTIDGKKAYFSELVNAAHAEADTITRHPQVADGLVMDAILSNLDVLGYDHENIMLTPDGQAHRMDNGGAFKFAENKKATLGGPRVAPDLTQAFGDVSDDDIIAQIADVAKNLTPEKITQAVTGAGFVGPQADEYIAFIIERIDSLVEWARARAPEGVFE